MSGDKNGDSRMVNGSDRPSYLMSRTTVIRES